jgi:hypothetical protein
MELAILKPEWLFTSRNLSAPLPSDLVLGLLAFKVAAMASKLSLLSWDF